MGFIAVIVRIGGERGGDGTGLGLGCRARLSCGYGDGRGEDSIRNRVR